MFEKLYFSSHGEAKNQIWTTGKPHSKGSIVYSSTGGSDAINS